MDHRPRPRAPSRADDLGVGGRPSRRRGARGGGFAGHDRGGPAMQFKNTFIPLRAAWSSPFVRWQGPTADVIEPRPRPPGDRPRARRARHRRGRSTSSSSASPSRRRQAFYGAPTLAAGSGFAGVSGPMIAQACATSVAASTPPPPPSRARPAVRGSSCSPTARATARTSSTRAPARPGRHADRARTGCIDSFGCDPNTGEGMLATAERVAAQGGFSKAEIDA